MEQNEKYYVPDLSEFHVGFEHWLFYPNSGNWELKWMKSKNLLGVEANLKAGRIRVKRLDHDDIVKEGWNEITPKKEYCILVDDVVFVITNNLPKYFEIVVGSSVKAIAAKDYIQIFSGEILNKSELRFQMKRLGIKK